MAHHHCASPLHSLEHEEAARYFVQLSAAVLRTVPLVDSQLAKSLSSVHLYVIFCTVGLETPSQLWSLNVMGSAAWSGSLLHQGCCSSTQRFLWSVVFSPTPSFTPFTSRLGTGHGEVKNLILLPKCLIWVHDTASATSLRQTLSRI